MGRTGNTNLSFDDILKRNFPIITDEYKAFAEEKSQCRKCSVYEHYKTVGMSEGNAKNPIFIFIGECPGRDEVGQVRPFIGPAGQRLRAELRKYPKVFRKDSVLLTNVLACRPLNNKFPGGDFKTETSKEVRTCTTHWLIPELKILKPKVIVTLGNPAMKYLRGDWGITANRGKWKFLPQCRAWSLPTFHPSYVIRSERSGQNHIVHQFEQDIETVVRMWKSIVGGDYRMSMSEDEWQRELALRHSVQLGLIK